MCLRHVVFPLECRESKARAKELTRTKSKKLERLKRHATRAKIVGKALHGVYKQIMAEKVGQHI